MKRKFWRWLSLYAAKKAGLKVETRKILRPAQNTPLPANIVEYPAPQRRSAMQRFNWPTPQDEES